MVNDTWVEQLLGRAQRARHARDQRWSRRWHAGRVVVMHRPPGWCWASSWWAVVTSAPYARLRVLVACGECGIEEYGLTRGRAARALVARHRPAGAECREWVRTVERERAELAQQLRGRDSDGATP